ncbi:zinc-binding dehydrogenase [Actinoplanes sp. TBRC 11911]|uniref:zinc-binding dehydrogenase n=1 Tax=Actinoplanes sp. TBRC 11911 TaxID=2729386 RepID=UPI00145D408D|nr:zinc-binding dehydrogenase [Actinoplanes sp. TBRC 11911]NMO55892.1 zinc-binding dehydrogenase [Actinoplanes sp. TBRC 11911]
MLVEGNAWRVVAFGDVRLERLSYDQMPAGHLLVRVRTAGAGMPDAMMVAGQFPVLSTPPFGLGEEVCGDVVAVGEGSRFTVGERIMGITAFLLGWGGYAEYAYVREQSAGRVPTRFSDEQAGGFSIGFRTAYHALVERAQIRAGETVVVLGAAGSSGVTAVRLAKALGATVIGVAGSDEKLAFAREAGADDVVSHHVDDLAAELGALTGGRGVDLIHDAVGGPAAEAAIKALGRNGRIVLAGLASGQPVKLDPLDMLGRNWGALGALNFGHAPEYDVAVWDRLIDLAEKGLLDTPVGRVWAFDEVPTMIAGQGSPPPGKSVVRVAD